MVAISSAGCGVAGFFNSANSLQQVTNTFISSWNDHSHWNTLFTLCSSTLQTCIGTWSQDQILQDRNTRSKLFFTKSKVYFTSFYTFDLVKFDFPIPPPYMFYSLSVELHDLGELQVRRQGRVGLLCGADSSGRNGHGSQDDERDTIRLFGIRNGVQYCFLNYIYWSWYLFTSIAKLLEGNKTWEKSVV
jgi:hypothetical protein